MDLFFISSHLCHEGPKESLTLFFTFKQWPSWNRILNHNSWYAWWEGSKYLLYTYRCLLLKFKSQLIFELYIFLTNHWSIMVCSHKMLAEWWRERVCFVHLLRGNYYDRVSVKSYMHWIKHFWPYVGKANKAKYVYRVNRMGPRKEPWGPR